PREEVVERPVAEPAHPVRLVLVLRDRLDELVREPAPRLEEVRLGLVRVREPVLARAVGSDPLDDPSLCLRHQTVTFLSLYSARPLESSASTDETVTLQVPDEPWPDQGQGRARRSSPAPSSRSRRSCRPRYAVEMNTRTGWPKLKPLARAVPDD